MWNKVRLAVPVLLASLLVSACYQVNMELDFNADGSGALSMETVVDSSIVRFLAVDGNSLREACSQIAEEVFLQSDFSGDGFRLDSSISEDSSCVATVRGEFTAEENALFDDGSFSITDNGWRLVLDGFGSVIDGIVVDADVDDLSLFDDVVLTLSIRLPGTPSDDHNAHRIEDGRFIWEFAGAGFEDAPTALRASSKADTSSDTWVILMIAGAIGGLVGAVAVLVAVSASRRRQKTASQPILTYDTSEDDFARTPWEPPETSASTSDKDDEDLPQARYRPLTEET